MQMKVTLKMIGEPDLEDLALGIPSILSRWNFSDIDTGPLGKPYFEFPAFKFDFASPKKPKNYEKFGKQRY